MKTLSNNSGFTLIEVSLVVVILSTIVAFFVPNAISQYNSTATRLAAATTAKQMTDICNASTSYQADKGTNATKISDLTGATPPYLKAMPIPSQGVTPFTDAFTVAGSTSTLTTATTSTNICSKLNELYAGGEAGAAPPIATTATLDMQCYGAVGGPYTITMRVYE
jgi:prepilin-type N-terminal cleavage/methylation domain-containing protein